LNKAEIEKYREKMRANYLDVAPRFK